MSERERPARTSLLQPPWSGMSLPGLLKGGATLRAGAPAVIEPPEVENLIGRPSRALTCRDLNTDVDLTAQKLRTLGLRPGDIALLHLPNTAEAIIALLAVQKAGAVPAPIGIFEGAERVAEAARLVDAAAIITVEAFAGLNTAVQCRDAAVAAMGVRFVAAFGRAVPEGVASLSDWDQVEFLSKAPFPKLPGAATALITFDETAGPLRALGRTHEQLVAEAAMAASLARVSTGSRVLATIPPASAAGVIYGVALPLLSGAVLELNALFDSCVFGAQLGDGAKTAVILPGAAAEAYQAHCASRAVRTESVVLIHRPQPDDLSALPTGKMRRDPRTVDMLCLGEAALVSSLRATQQVIGHLPQTVGYSVPGVMQTDAPALRLTASDRGGLMAEGTLCATPAEGPGGPLATGFAGERRGTQGFTLATRTAGTLTSAA